MTPPRPWNRRLRRFEPSSSFISFTFSRQQLWLLGRQGLASLMYPSVQARSTSGDIASAFSQAAIPRRNTFLECGGSTPLWIFGGGCKSKAASSPALQEGEFKPQSFRLPRRWRRLCAQHLIRPCTRHLRDPAARAGCPSRNTVSRSPPPPDSRSAPPPPSLPASRRLSSPLRREDWTAATPAPAASDPPPGRRYRSPVLRHNASSPQGSRHSSGKQFFRGGGTAGGPG